MGGAGHGGWHLRHPGHLVVLSLAAPSSPDWTDRALAALDVVLLDHAHCEKKAASTAMGLIFRYQTHVSLMRPLSALAREELAHFELVLDHLDRRDIPFERLVPSPYAAELMKGARRGEPDRLLDTLICCALIEARSCERMRLLAEALEARGHALGPLYRGLLASEARHHTTYLDLARGIFPPAAVRERLAHLAAHEARVLSSLDPLPRMHG